MSVVQSGIQLNSLNDLCIVSVTDIYVVLCGYLCCSSMSMLSISMLHHVRVS